MTTALTTGQLTPEMRQRFLNLSQPQQQTILNNLPNSLSAAMLRMSAPTINAQPLAQPMQQPMAQPMAQGQGPSFRFQDLNKAFQLDPRNTLANTLMQQGMRGGPVRTPLEGIGRLSQSLVGAMLQKRALDRLEGQETTRQENLQTALQNLNLENNPALAALAQIDPLSALTAGVQQESAMQQIGARADLGRTTQITSAIAKSLGLDTSQGQVYQQDAKGGLSLVQQGRPPQPLGSSFQALAGNRVLSLYNKADRTEEETQEMNFLNQQLKRPRVYTTQNPDGSSQQIKDPGFDALGFLQGGQPGQTTTETTGGSQQQDGQTTGPEVIGTKVAKLTEQEASYVPDYASAAADIQTVIDIMFNGDLYNGEFDKITSVAAGSEVGQALAGSEAQRLNNALMNLIDLRLRKRTGATANESEIANYSNQVFPGLTTREETMRDRVARLVREINSGFDAFSKGRVLGDVKTLVLPEKAKASQNDSMTVEF